MGHGAGDGQCKPLEEMETMLPLVAENSSAFFRSVNDLPPEAVIFGRSQSMRGVQQRVENAAGANAPILIQGESGTGKEIIAGLLHRLSPWYLGPFVKVNCPAIPGTLLESELFGYERGAFTGAYGAKPGRVELAHRGTLFLDEIAELDMAMQAKLLQLLQDGQFCRIGAREDTRVEVRVVCATNRKLEKEIGAGSFRQDLYYRINVLDIVLPPLRERREDIPDLANYFLKSYGAGYRRRVTPLSNSTLRFLQAYEWPGNIRQLENLIKRYVILGSEDTIISELLNVADEAPDQQISSEGAVSLKDLTRQASQVLERKVILQALQVHHWNRKQTAVHLGISYQALLYKMRQAGLPSRRNAVRLRSRAGSPVYGI